MAWPCRFLEWKVRGPMRYEGVVYRPPSEADSVLIQATIGCPHNRCTFCAMYKGKKFKIRPVVEIKKDILLARQWYGPNVRTMFFPDGNTIFMKTSQLVEIFDFARKLFPRLERITVYGSARFIVKKTVDELRLLREAGLGRIHSGMESGDDAVLARICKGATQADVIEAGLMVKEAGIELSEYYLVGAGGRELSTQHALSSAKALNQIDPDFIRLRTLVPQPNTPLYEEFLKGDFKLLSPHESLREIMTLVENLEVNSHLLSDHISNHWDVHGKLPHDKHAILAGLEKALSIDERLLQRNLIGCPL